MLDFNEDLMRELLLYLIPQSNIYSLRSSCRYIKELIDRAVSNDQWKTNHRGRFSGTRLLTGFQLTRLDRLNQGAIERIKVQNLDNALTIASTLARSKGLLLNYDRSRQEINIGNQTIGIVQSYGGPRPIEHTPLWLSFSREDIIMNMLSDSALGKTVTLNRSLSNRLGITFLDPGMDLLYQHFQDYDTIISDYNTNTQPLASMLMEFSPKPKNLILCEMFGSRPDYNLPFPSRKRIEYTTLFANRRTLPVLNVPTRITMAELALILLGYDKNQINQTQEWLKTKIEKPEAIIFIKDKLYSGSDFPSHHNWLYLNPRQSWKSFVIQNTRPEIPKESQRQFHRLNPIVRLRLNYSLNNIEEAYTTSELKTICYSYGLVSSGTRERLIMRLLRHDNAVQTKVDVYSFG